MIERGRGSVRWLNMVDILPAAFFRSKFEIVLHIVFSSLNRDSPIFSGFDPL